MGIIQPLLNSKQQTVASSHAVQQSNIVTNPPPSLPPTPTDTKPSQESKDANYRDVSTLEDPEPDHNRCRGKLLVRIAIE